MANASPAHLEWRAHWPLVLAAFVGWSFPAAAVHSTGLFIEPLTQEFGWSRTQITAGVSLGVILAVPFSPFVGALIDRWGVRRIALPGLVLTSLAIAGLGLANGSTAQWMTLWAIYGMAALLLKSTIWTAAVSGVFSAGRSLALGVTLSGSAFATAAAPPLAQWLTDSYGWREAYAAIGFGWGIPALLLSVLFLADARDIRRRKGETSHAAQAGLSGLSVKEAARSLPLLRIGLATLITLLMGSTLVVHKVPILTEAGVTRETAALLASLSGIASIMGKLGTGWLMGRYDAGWVGGLTNTAVALALVLLLEGIRSPPMIVASMVIVGYAGGAKLQICAYLTTVYGGMRNFGKIFGMMASVIALAGAVGPLAGGVAYDLAGDYNTLILAGIPLSVLSGLLLIRLGPAPVWSRPSQDTPAGATPASSAA